MKTARPGKPATKPLIITKPIEKVLAAIHFHRYMTSEDVTRLLYSPRSKSHVREILSHLAAANYLYRFELPHTSRGNTEKIYTSGSKARDFISHELGLPVDFYFRPYKLRHLSYSQVIHNLTLTRFLIAAHAWAAKQSDFKLVQTRICYELAHEAATVEVSKDTLPAGKPRKTETPRVIPDAWVEFERLKNGKHERYHPIMLEVDRGSKHSLRLKRDLHNRIAFIKSGAYRKMFGTEAVMIAYITTGETRRKAMCAWAQQVLAELHMENWSHIFRFSSVEFDQLYTTPMFDEPVWYRPDSPIPVLLFPPAS
jgi:Replication-relaxation